MIPSPRDPTEPSRVHTSALATAARAGDRDAFAELYRLHHREVLAFVRSRIGCRHLAEDIVSETFIRALRAIDGFTWSGGGFCAWLITIARNLLADHYKSSRHRRESVTCELSDADWIACDTEDLVLDRLAAETVRAAVECLNPLQRACIEARFLNQLSVAETAELLHRDERAIKTLQYRATRSLARDIRLATELAA